VRLVHGREDIVTAHRGSTARRYLLGLAGEDECAAVEREYFADETALDRMAAVEDDLVEEYVTARLPADERDRFERHYLASPPHRTRVEAIRRLSGMASDGRQRARAVSFRYLAIAATALIAVGGIVWIVAPQRHESAGVLTSAPPPAQPATPQPVPDSRHIFAVSLSPIAVRSASEARSFVIPAGTDLVLLQLEGGVDSAKAPNARAVIQTVAGDEVWRGAGLAAADLPANVIARFNVPAAQLTVDDYIVVLFDGVPNAERERNRYVLRLRSR
jgi:hypothetical protein